MRQNMYSSGVFTGVDLFPLKFYLDKVVPYQPFLATGSNRYWLPDGKDLSLCILSF